MIPPPDNGRSPRCVPETETGPRAGPDWWPIPAPAPTGGRSPTNEPIPDWWPIPAASPRMRPIPEADPTNEPIPEAAPTNEPIPEPNPDR